MPFPIEGEPDKGRSILSLSLLSDLFQPRVAQLISVVCLCRLLAPGSQLILEKTTS
jgi:hypothetical protein